MDQLTEALRAAVKAQMEDKTTTFIEVILNQELGEPFRRDAMKKPVAVAGIDAKDMRPPQGACARAAISHAAPPSRREQRPTAGPRTRTSRERRAGTQGGM